MTHLCRELPTLVAHYELAQRNRIASGALLRSAASPGSNATLEELHATELRAERSLARAMAACVEEHPTWPWLESVKGIGPTLSARLLARLRIERAPTPSSFWQYCGLSTVPGDRYRCLDCAATITIAAGRTPPTRHHMQDGRACAAALIHDRAPEVRVAVRYATRGQRRPFDAEARSLCHMIGTSFLRRGTRYRRVYDARRERLEGQKPGWSKMHRHLAAMRVMEKLFLAHLWMVWRGQTGAEVRLPYEVARRGRAGSVISPWEMAGA